MPNHCWNLLEVVDGDLSDLEPYLVRNETDYGNEVNLDFDKIVPMPPEYKNAERWYGWCCEHWGTKWNSYEGQENSDGVSFSTAWGPPTPVIVALAAKIGKGLRLIYDESGMDFCGEVLTYPDGTIQDNVYSPRSDAPDELREELMIDEEEELDENY